MISYRKDGIIRVLFTIVNIQEIYIKYKRITNSKLSTKLFLT